MSHVARPRLRAVDVTVQHEGGRRRLILRDPSGVTDSVLSVAIEFLPVLRHFDGAGSHADIHAAVARDARDARGARSVGNAGAVTVSEIRALAATLDAHGFLHGPSVVARREALHRAWAEAPTRPARFAGSAYPADPDVLRATLDGHLRGAVHNPQLRPLPDAPVRALISPHIDLHRGGAVYGHAWAPVAQHPEADTYFLLGTCHAPMHGAFALTDKDFETPLGTVPCARDVVASLQRTCTDVDLRADELCHRGEHSIEFQVVWLRHVLGNRPVRVVPVLVGLGAARGAEPGTSALYSRVLDALRGEITRLGPRACVVAGVDMAHVGPRFGDRDAPDRAAREHLAVRDRESLDRALQLDAGGWFRDTSSDDAVRRVCGLAPVYAMAAVVPPAWGLRGWLTGYDQAVDRTDGSVVTYASAAWCP